MKSPLPPAGLGEVPELHRHHVLGIEFHELSRATVFLLERQATDLAQNM
jgi:hypothetical protein